MVIFGHNTYTEVYTSTYPCLPLENCLDQDKHGCGDINDN